MRYAIPLLLTLIVLLSGCIQTGPVCNKPYIQVDNECCLDRNDNNICDKDDTTMVVDDFYSKLKMQDYEGTLDMYHEKWFTVTPREKTTEFLEKVDGKLGKVEDYVLVDWNSQSYVGEGSGNYITLVYEVNRTKYSSQETFTIFNPEGTGKFLILGYNINSMGLI